MISVAALLEINFILPSLDYQDLFKLTKILSNNNEEDIEQMYRRMCFNVFIIISIKSFSAKISWC